MKKMAKAPKTCRRAHDIILYYIILYYIILYYIILGDARAHGRGGGRGGGILWEGRAPGRTASGPIDAAAVRARRGGAGRGNEKARARG